jgi:hypothetical protein
MMVWLYALIGVVVLLLAVSWVVDRRRRARRNDGGTFDRNVDRVRGEGNARNYFAGPP